MSSAAELQDCLKEWSIKGLVLCRAQRDRSLYSSHVLLLKLMFGREVRAPTYRIDGISLLSICISDELKKWPSHQIISSAASCVTSSKQDSCCRQSVVDDGSHFHSPINWTIKTQMPAMDSTAVCPMKARLPISCQICCVEVHCVFLLNVFRTHEELITDHTGHSDWSCRGIPGIAFSCVETAERSKKRPLLACSCDSVENLLQRAWLLWSYWGASQSELGPVLQPSPHSQWANSLISFLTVSVGSHPSLCSPQDFSPQTLSPTGWLSSSRQFHSLWYFSLSLSGKHTLFLYMYLQHDGEMCSYTIL